MKTHVLKGSKQDIASILTQISGEVREVIVFVDEPPPSAPAMPDADDIFAEMRPHMVNGDGLDDSRQAIYTKMEGE